MENKKIVDGEFRKSSIVYAAIFFFAVLFSSFSIMSTVVSAAPVPLGVDGTVYTLDGITEIYHTIPITIINLDTLETISGFTGKGTIGRYSFSLSWDVGSRIQIIAYDGDTYDGGITAERNITLNGVIHNVNLLLNMSPPNPIYYPSVIISNPITSTYTNELYLYQVQAIDNNTPELNLTYLLIENPPGMTIDSNGLITWIPNSNQTNIIGNHTIQINVNNGYNSTSQEYLLEVLQQPITLYYPPIITSTPNTSAYSGENYTYNVQAYDINVPTLNLTFSFIENPNGMTIDSNGLIRWFPDASQAGVLGNHTIIIKVSNEHNSTLQEYILEVSLRPIINHPPIFISTPKTSVSVYKLYNYYLRTYDSDGDSVSIKIIKAPRNMIIWRNHLLWVPFKSDIGVHKIILKATDSKGASSYQYFNVKVYNHHKKKSSNSIRSSESTGLTDGMEYELYDESSNKLADESDSSGSIDISLDEQYPDENSYDNIPLEYLASLEHDEDPLDYIYSNGSQNISDDVYSVDLYSDDETYRPNNDKLNDDKLNDDLAYKNSDSKNRGIAIQSSELSVDGQIIDGQIIEDIEDSSIEPIIISDNLFSNLNPPSKIVYKYFSLNTANFQYIFEVPSLWLNERNINSEDITVSKYVGGSWQNMDVKLLEISETVDDETTYSVILVDEGYYAIAVKESVQAQLPVPTERVIAQQYVLWGHIDGLKKNLITGKPSSNSEIYIMNTRTNELVKSDLVILPTTKYGYYIKLDAREGDIIQIYLKTQSFKTEVIELLDSVTVMQSATRTDIILNRQKGLGSITGGAISYFSVYPHIYFGLFLLAFILLTIYTFTIKVFGGTKEFAGTTIRNSAAHQKYENPIIKNNLNNNPSDDFFEKDLRDFVNTHVKRKK